MNESETKKNMDSSDDSDIDFEGFEIEDVRLAEEKLNQLLEEASDIDIGDLSEDESENSVENSDQDE